MVQVLRSRVPLPVRPWAVPPAHEVVCEALVCEQGYVRWRVGSAVAKIQGRAGVVSHYPAKRMALSGRHGGGRLTQCYLSPGKRECSV